MSLRSYVRRSLHPKTLLYWLNRTAQLRQRDSVRHRGDRGFTLTEVLVATIIGALIVSGLLGVMVELLTSDAREAARNETQREMQLAIDYISTDLREAVYVYDGDCMAAVASESSDPELIAKNCAGLFPSYVGVPDDQSTPVLAFWKLDDLPAKVRENCRSANLTEEGVPPCVSGRAYTLVVYYLTKNEGNPTWSGKARIQRFAFPRYNISGLEVTGYVDPAKSGFESWPKVDGDAAGYGVKSLNGIATLVDFVDSRPMTEIDELTEAGGASVQCPTGYALTPSDATLTQFGFDGVRNFYACIRIPKALLASEVTESEEEGQSSFNQKVILFIRGNAAGKPGIKDANEGFMPAISTQVLNRGVKDKVPKSE